MDDRCDMSAPGAGSRCHTREMNLHEIYKTIIDTVDDHWNVINSGPQFNYSLGTIDDVATVTGYHETRAVLIDDVDIAIEYGMSDDPFDRKKNWTEDWAPFPDKKISAEFCDIFYRGALVDRTLLAIVDGGRATLPLPTKESGQWIAMDRPYHLARLVDSFNGGREFESYFERSGITKWPA